MIDQSGSKAPIMVRNFSASWFPMLFIGVFYFFPTAIFGSEMKHIAVLGVGVFFVLIMLTKVALDSWLLSYFLLMVFSISTIIISMVLGLSFSSDSIFHLSSIIRPLYLFFIFVSFYIYFNSASDFDVSTKRLLVSLNAAMFLELVLVIFQGFGFSHISGALFDQEKARGFDTIMRGTGSFGNPNTLSIVSIFTLLITVFVSKSKSLILLSMSMCFVIVLLCGSRTGLFVLAMCLVIVPIFSSLRITTKIFSVIGSLVFVYTAYVLGAGFLERFTYIWSAFKLLEDPLSLLEVNSLSVRLENWTYKKEFFNNFPHAYKYIFGVGFYEFYKVLDHEFFFLYFRTGFLGAASYLIFFMYPFIWGSIALRQSHYFRLCCAVLAVGFIWCFLFEFFSDFTAPVLVAVCFSFLCAYKSRHLRGV